MRSTRYVSASARYRRNIRAEFEGLFPWHRQGVCRNKDKSLPSRSPLGTYGIFVEKFGHTEERANPGSAGRIMSSEPPPPLPSCRSLLGGSHDSGHPLSVCISYSIHMLPQVFCPYLHACIHFAVRRLPVSRSCLFFSNVASTRRYQHYSCRLLAAPPRITPPGCSVVLNGCEV